MADLLEVYDLCLLLGFAGRYSLGNRGELRSIMQQTAEKLYRIRQPSGELSPYAALPPGGAIASGGDPWLKGLMYGAIASVVLTVALFVIYNIFLNSGARSLSDFASQG